MRFPRTLLPLSFLALVLFSGISNGQGLVLPAAGPIHRSMGGASVAAPLDALGANYWNPAAIRGLPHNEVAFAGEFIYADAHLFSSAPLQGRQGLTRSDSGLGALSGVAMVYHREESPITIGMFLGSSAGGSINYPGDANNPFLSPTGPLGRLRLGSKFASATFLSTAFNIAYQVNDRLVIGAGPTIGTSLMSLTPAFFAGAGDANNDGLRTFPAATNGRPFWGGGVQAGATYQVNDALDLGFSIRSPLWFETFRWKSENEVGVGQTIRLPWSMPMIISFGGAYKGFDRLLLAADVRWFDYRTTKTLGTPVSEGGVGWDSIWAFAFGAQYQLNDQLSVRAGYVYNQSPIDETLTLFNVQLPAITQHQLSCGFTMQLTENVSSSLSYVYAFENEVSGPVIQAAGSTVGFDIESHSIVFGVNVKFGPCCSTTTTCEPSSGDYDLLEEPRSWMPHPSSSQQMQSPERSSSSIYQEYQRSRVDLVSPSKK